VSRLFSKKEFTVSKYTKHPLTWAILLTLVYLVIMMTRPSPAFFGVEGEWFWNGRPPSPVTYPRWWPPILGLGLTVLVAAGLDRIWDRSSAGVHVAGLGFLMVMVVLLQILLKRIHYADPMEYYLYRVIGPSDGFWQIAVWIEDIGAYLRTYPAQMRAVRETSIHPPVHPPGNIVYIWLWRQLFQSLPALAGRVAHWLRGYRCDALAFVRLTDAQIAASVGQMTLVPLTALTVPPLYALAKKLSGARNGWRVTALYVLIPALTFFSLRWDTVYPFFLISALYIVHVGLERQQPGWWFVAGVIVSFGSFFSLGNGTFGLALGLYALRYLWLQKPARIWQAWRGWLALLLGGISIWAVYQLTLGVSLLDVLAASMEPHLELEQGRSYGLWLFYNLYSFLAFAGVPIAALFGLEACRAWRKLPRRWSPPALVISATVLLLNLSGIVRGEVGRMWLPWMAGIALSLGLFLRRQPRGSRVFRSLLILMAVQTMVTALYMRSNSPMMSAYAPRTLTRTMDEAAPEHTLDVRLGDHVLLLGYDLSAQQVRPGETLSLTLHWGALERLDRPYTVFIHVLDAGGELLTQADGMPVDGTLPTSCWLAGELIPDPHDITIPAGAASGTYTVIVGLYDRPTMQRLPVAGGEGSGVVALPTTLRVSGGTETAPGNTGARPHRTRYAAPEGVGRAHSRQRGIGEIMKKPDALFNHASG
jgi:hypothetical protein